jgi:16S rRNA (guanine527-N7)-methyltransferase
MTPQRPLTDPREVLISGSRELGISVRTDAADKMMHYMALLREWNSRVNLTAITYPLEIAVLHFLDSLTVFKVIPLQSGLRILDVGTGAGFPGMVLHIVDESVELTVLDRDTKKIVFLKHLANELGLKRITFLNLPLAQFLSRCADSPYDVVVSRAFSSDSSLLDGFHVALHRNGHLVRMTGPAGKRGDLSLDHFLVSSAWEGTLPFSVKFRRVVLYQRLF